MPTIAAGFSDFAQAAKAGGALLDHGVPKEQFNLLVGRAHEGYFHADGSHLEDLEKQVEGGVTTTTAQDAAKGAASGAGAGIVLGALAGLAALFIPGYGVVVGGGALATAVAAALGTTVGGAVAGGVTGYLKDMGVGEAAARNLDGIIHKDGAIIILQLSDEPVAETELRRILEKYGAISVTSTDDPILESLT